MPYHKTQENTVPSQSPTCRPSLPTPLTPHWAFVVQLRQGTSLEPDAMQGRVEHIVSGQASLFSSLEEFRAFMERVLTEVGEKPP